MDWQQQQQQQQYPTSTSPLPIRRTLNDDGYVDMRIYQNYQSPNKMESSQPSARLLVDDRGSSSVPSSSVTGGSDYCSRPSCYEKDFKITTLTRNIDQCHDEMRNLRTMLVEKKQDLGSLQQRLTEVEGECSRLKQARQQELGSLQQRVAMLEGENVRLEGECGRLKQARQSLEIASIRHDQIHLQKLQSQVESLQRRNQELMSELARTNPGDQQELVQLRGQRDKLQQEVQYLTGQLMHRKNSLDPREVEMYRAESRDLRAEVEVLRQQVLAYTEDFHTERADRQRAQAALNKVQEERDNLQKTIDLLTQDSSHTRHR